MIQSWKLGLTWLVMSGAITTFSNAYAWANCADAQITPDATLPNNSRVTTQGNIRTIEGGTQAGSNLFHSFQEFSVPTGSTAYFNNVLGIQNIISRVTGKSISNIDGLIRANGTANLFLLNPNGIIFGRNASLNIGGSFVASTASSLKFANGSQFSATAAQSAPLLTISVPIGLQFGTNSEKIQVQGDGQGIRSTTELIDTKSGLRVQPNQTLALVGGDVTLEGATLKTAGGRIELGSVGDNSLVSLTPINKGFTLNYNAVQNFRNIQLSQQAAVDASGAGSGDIQIWGRRVTLTNGSQVEASTLRAEQGGNIVVNAQDAVQLIGTSADSQFPTGLFANAYPTTTGVAGNVTINTRELLVRDGGQVSTSTFGAGNAGNLTINTRELLIRDGGQVSASTFGAGNVGNLTITADSVQLTGNSAAGNASTLLATSEQGATGAAGDLTINTRELLVRDGGQVSVGTWGPLKGGNLAVTADSVQVIGALANGQPSSLNTNAFRTATGAAGNLTINTRELLVRDGGQVSASSFGFGAGNAGNLTVTADSVQLIGASSINPQSRSTLLSETYSTGTAGNLTINTRELLVQNTAFVSARTYGAGNAGNLTVNADSVELTGNSPGGDASTLIVASERGATGAAGDLTINTSKLSLQDGAQVSAATWGPLKGGNLIVRADSVQVIGIGTSSSSSLNANAFPTATGTAGNLTINTRELLVRDGGQVSASTFGAGNGGNLTVKADSVQVIGTSGLFTETDQNSTGSAGNLTINTRALLVRDRAGVFVQSLGKGNAGNLTVNARSVSLDNATFTANTQSINTDPNKEQATINLRGVRDLILRRGSSITTNASGENVIGGNINIDTDFLVALGNSDISANSANFRGGNVRINTQGILGTQFRDAPTPESDITATGASPEFSGTVNINTLGIEPNSGLINLPTQLVEARVAQTCQPSGNQAQSEFVMTGRGGLPPSPEETLSSDAIQVDWVTLNPKVENRNQGVSTNITTPEPNSMVEATGWTIAHNGNIILTASATPVLPGNSRQTPAKCHAN